MREWFAAMHAPAQGLCKLTQSARQRGAKQTRAAVRWAIGGLEGGRADRALTALRT